MGTQKTIEEYIANQIQENLNLDYKAAGAFSRENNVKDKKIEDISKDVSAMANSQGGVIIYGIKEFGGEKRYLPEKIDPIDQTVFSKEWLEQIINSNIHPRIQGIIIHPVQINTGSNHCVYVLEIPQSNTAHQAKDKKYYKRYNFESVAMEDYEIRDTMNRASIPNVSIRFGLYYGVHTLDKESDSVLFRGLRIIIKNEGSQVVNRFKILAELTKVGWYDDDEFMTPNLVEINNKEDEFLRTWLSGNIHGDVVCNIIYQPQFILFPQEEFDIGEKLRWGYIDTDDMMSRAEEWEKFAGDAGWEIKWKLFADNMPFKEGIEKVCDIPIISFKS